MLIHVLTVTISVFILSQTLSYSLRRYHGPHLLPTKRRRHVSYLLQSSKSETDADGNVDINDQMKKKEEIRRMSNVPGNFYVDRTLCYDCDVCRWMCPSVFDRKGLQASVYHQPSSNDEKIQALGALLACPVGAIKTEVIEPLAKVASEIFPALIDPDYIPNVFHVGYHASSSYGATPYFLKRKRGNVMIDSPRYNPRLANKIDAMGGINTMIITHKDDLADHAKWKKRFPDMQRVIHMSDVTYDCQDIEIQVISDSQPFQLDDDVWLLHTPGHTLGSLSLYAETYDDDDEKGESILFSGDLIASRPPHEVSKMYEKDQMHPGSKLTGFKPFNRAGYNNQIESLQQLVAEKWPFQWILPAHGRMIRFSSIEEKNKEINAMMDFFQQERGMRGRIGIHVVGK